MNPEEFSSLNFIFMTTFAFYKQSYERKDYRRSISKSVNPEDIQYVLKINVCQTCKPFECRKI